MADIFGLKNIIRKHEEEAKRIALLKTIITAHDNGKTSASICYPMGASPDILNFLRSFGFKVHNIQLKELGNPNAQTCMVRWD